ncbi:hypothetical protein KCU71_g2200, partial [Aureobasidium melanogenum]
MVQIFRQRYGDLPAQEKNRISRNHAKKQYRNPAHTSSGFGKWLPAGHLGQGGEGVAAAWVCVNALGRIVDRVVIKQVMPGQAEFNSPQNWVNGNVGGIPREYHNADLLRGELEAIGDEAIRYMAYPRGYGQVSKRCFTYRLYSEYCAYGDLRTLINLQEDHVPEPFIWHFLKSMLTSLEAMDNIDRIGMIHKDLQAGNVLMGDPNPHHYAFFPTPKIADFGSARMARGSLLKRRSRDQGGDGCCQPYAPPELAGNGNWLVTRARSEAHHWLTCKTNIWQLGLLALCLVRGKCPPEETMWTVQPNPTLPLAQRLNFASNPANGKREIDVENDFIPERHHTYSPELMDMIRSMLRFQPRHRPTPQEALKTLEDALAADPGLIEGMDTYKPPKNRADWDDTHEHYLDVTENAQSRRLGDIFG